MTPWKLNLQVGKLCVCDWHLYLYSGSLLPNPDLHIQVLLPSIFIWVSEKQLKFNTSQTELLIILSKLTSFSVMHFILCSQQFKFKTLSIDSFLMHPTSNVSANLIVSICNYIHNPSFSSYLLLPLWSEPPSSGRTFKLVCLLPPLPHAPPPHSVYSPQSNQNNPFKM